MTGGSFDYEFIFTAADAQNTQNRQINGQLPSYEEAIQQSLNPSTANITPLARPTVIHQPSNHDESRSLLSDPELFVVSNNINNNNKPNPEDEVQELGGSSSSGSNFPISSERSISGVHYGNDEIPSPPEYTLSDAIYKRDIDGVTSHDPKLNSEPESLLRFFMEHNDKPEMAIKIHGYQTEADDDNYTSTDSDRIVHCESTVERTEFNFTFDLTEYVSINGIIRTNDQKEIMELLNDYVKNESMLKNIEMKKVVTWDYESLTKAISTVIRQQGYRNNLRITFLLRNHIVHVESDPKFARFASNIWIQILFIITCLWIIFLPIFWLYKLYKASNKKQIRSDFTMTINEKDWFDKNVNSIIANVRWL
ncbi:hypothetical protein RclHR1_00980014 [Rhizophagus clarus]|uniref:Uncharacterized protein n=1 Tax=Rhizophagus clarus TaxID=94130 RepID=A0A2Z6SQR9_9GLOM|nr:hypothetical protein RclHR1_00980014 [Rhizophagus clarus]GES81164.1 hypothetical protein RCL_jg18002.t1 [Rhizophagus clarus]